ncbi:MAG: sodium:proton antiporter [Candidatus Hydrogenedentota bacterium]
MSLSLSIVVGALFAAGVYLLLRRSLAQLVLGVLLVSHGANLLIFTAADTQRDAAPLAASGISSSAMADPVPQALVLTAIVISFGLAAFLLALYSQAGAKANQDDTDALGEEAY